MNHRLQLPLPRKFAQFWCHKRCPRSYSCLTKIGGEGGLLWCRGGFAGGEGEGPANLERWFFECLPSPLAIISSPATYTELEVYRCIHVYIYTYIYIHVIHIVLLQMFSNSMNLGRHFPRIWGHGTDIDSSTSLQGNGGMPIFDHWSSSRMEDLSRNDLPLIKI